MRLVRALASFSLAAIATLVVVDANAAQPGSSYGSAFEAPTNSFRLPWQAGAMQYLTQDADDDCCGDHVGANKWAFDFALPAGGAFEVEAPASGTIVHVKMSSSHGCADASCVSDANYLVIDHGDGTQTTLLHLAQGSLDPALECGSFVRRGQHLATTGSTGWSTGVHLHVERDAVKRDLKKTCECGADGMGCSASSVEWSLFWPSSTQPNLPVSFDEWQAADHPNDRRGLIGPSRNVDDGGRVVTLSTARRFSAISGDWADESTGAHDGLYHWAKGGAVGSISLKDAGIDAGVYEVWAYVPLDGSPSSLGEATFELKGAPSSARGVLDEAVVGGAYHPIKGLERVRLSGNGQESIVVSGSDDAPSKSIAVDALVFHRIPEEPIAKTTTGTWKLNNGQMGLAMLEPKGGGMVMHDRVAGVTLTTSHRSSYAWAGFASAGIFGLGAILQRRRARRSP